MEDIELTQEQKDVLYNKATEKPFSSKLLHEKRKGTYVTADTRVPVFRSEDKFDSGTGWPSFSKAIEKNILIKKDFSHFMIRNEVLGKNDNHLGHVFKDKSVITGERYCINGAALKFIPDNN